MTTDGAYWGRSPSMEDFRTDVIARFRDVHKGDIIQGIGDYWGTIEVQFQTEGTPNDAAFTVTVVPGNAVVDTAFSLGIGDVSTTWFSTTNTPHILTGIDTNLQNPGLNLFADEVFIIEAISAKMRGLRIGYSPAQIATMKPVPTGGILRTLQGNQLVHDQFGQMVPFELFNQFSDVYRMAKSLEEVATLHFKWVENGIGGSTKTADKMIAPFNVITQNERGVKRTSGGATILDLPQGFIWCLDKMWQPNQDSGGNGLFDAELQLTESVSYPFKPTQVFGSNGRLPPVGTALYWEIHLYGTSLLPGQRTTRRLEHRISR